MARRQLTALLFVCASFVCWSHAAQLSLAESQLSSESKDVDEMLPIQHRNVSCLPFHCSVRSDDGLSTFDDDTTTQLWTRAPNDDIPKSMAWLGRHSTTRNGIATALLGGAATYGWVTFRQVTHQDLIPKFLQPKTRAAVTKRDDAAGPYDVGQEDLMRREPAQGRIRAGLFGLAMGGALVHMHENHILGQFADTFNPKQTKRGLLEGQDDTVLKRTPEKGKWLAYPIYAALGGTLLYGANQWRKPKPVEQMALHVQKRSSLLARRDGWTRPYARLSPGEDQIDIHWKSGRTSTYHKSGPGRHWTGPKGGLPRPPRGRKLREKARKIQEGIWSKKLDDSNRRAPLPRQQALFLTSGSSISHAARGKREWQVCMYAFVAMLMVVLLAAPAEGTALPRSVDTVSRLAERAPPPTAAADVVVLPEINLERRDGWTTVANDNLVIKISPSKDRVNVHWKSGKTTTYYHPTRGGKDVSDEQAQRMMSIVSSNSSSSLRGRSKGSGWAMCSLALVAMFVLLLGPSSVIASEPSSEVFRQPDLQRRDAWTMIENEHAVTKISPDKDRVNVVWSSGKVTTFFKQNGNHGQIGNLPTLQNQQAMSPASTNASSSLHSGVKRRAWTMYALAFATMAVLLMCPTGTAAAAHPTVDKSTSTVLKRDIGNSTTAWHTPSHFYAKALISPDHSLIKIVWHSGNVTIFSKAGALGAGNDTSAGVQSPPGVSTANAGGPQAELFDQRWKAIGASNMGANATVGGLSDADVTLSRRSNGAVAHQGFSPAQGVAFARELPSSLPVQPFHNTNRPRTTYRHHFKPDPNPKSNVEHGVQEAFAKIGEKDLSGSTLPRRVGLAAGRGEHGRRDDLGDDSIDALVRRSQSFDSTDLTSSDMLTRRDGWTQPSQHFAVAKISPSHDQVNIVWNSGKVTRFRKLAANSDDASAFVASPADLRSLDGIRFNGGARTGSGCAGLMGFVLASCVTLVLLVQPAPALSAAVVHYGSNAKIPSIIVAAHQEEFIQTRCTHGTCWREAITTDPVSEVTPASTGVRGKDGEEFFVDALQTRAVEGSSSFNHLPSLSRSRSGFSTDHGAHTSVSPPKFSAKSAAGVALGLGLTGLMVVNMASSIQTRDEHGIDVQQQQQHLVKRGRNPATFNACPSSAPSSSPYVPSAPGLKMSPLPAHYQQPGSEPHVTERKTKGGNGGRSTTIIVVENKAPPSRDSKAVRDALVAATCTTAYFAFRTKNQQYQRRSFHEKTPATFDTAALLDKRGGKFTPIHALIGGSAALGAGGLTWHALKKDGEAKKSGYGGIKPIEDKIW